MRNFLLGVAVVPMDVFVGAALGTHDSGGELGSSGRKPCALVLAHVLASIDWHNNDPT